MSLTGALPMMRTLMAIDTQRWEPFFTTTATASAALAGLLFVALSLNRDKLVAKENKPMLRLAQLSFSDYLYVFTISLVFLIPEQGDIALACELGFFGVRRMGRLIRHARDTSHDVSRKFLDWQTLQNYVLQVLCAVGLIIISYYTYFHNPIAPYLVAVIVLALVASASWNAWLLLVMEKDFAKRA